MEHRSAEEMEATTEKFLQDLKAVLDDGEKLLKAGAQNLSERGMAARVRLKAALDVARETRRKLQARARTGVKATDRVIREHPYEAIAIALGIGVVIGAILNRE